MEMLLLASRGDKKTKAWENEAAGEALSKQMLSDTGGDCARDEMQQRPPNHSACSVFDSTITCLGIQLKGTLARMCKDVGQRVSSLQHRAD